MGLLYYAAEGGENGTESLTPLACWECLFRLVRRPSFSTLATRGSVQDHQICYARHQKEGKGLIFRGPAPLNTFCDYTHQIAFIILWACANLWPLMC